MTAERGDTADRSLAHWSETKRTEMEAFYAVATLDYRELVSAWGHTPKLTLGPLRILDVACGSGKFPSALREVDTLQSLPPGVLTLDLLDPSPFSVDEAARSLAPPMVAGRRLVCTLQDLPEDACDYDVVWAVHALYALPEAELATAVERFLSAMAEDGWGFVGHATREAHYLRFYDAYLPRFRPEGTPYLDAETVIAAFEAAGATVTTERLTYVQSIADESVLEGFLQRCLFDGSLGLADMKADEGLGAYLAERTGPDGVTHLTQHVAMITVRR